MASDSFQKPQRAHGHSLIDSLCLYSTRLYLYFHRQGLRPKSWWPWHTVPVLCYKLLALAWVALTSCCESIGRFCIIKPFRFVWYHALLPFLVLIWTGILPRNIKMYLKKVNWIHIGFKVFSRTLLAIYGLMVMSLFYGIRLGFNDDLSRTSTNGNQYTEMDLESYFNSFTGSTVCNLRASDLYIPPVQIGHNQDTGSNYCSTRSTLLNALSQGGRHGFDAPYVPYGCTYRWYSVQEICAILSRFDAIIFVGDDMLATIYAGLNILLRRNLLTGALSPGPNVSPEKLHNCSCNSQFSDATCRKFFIRDSGELTEISAGSTYACHLRQPHALLQVDSLPMPTEIISKFNGLVHSGSRNSYRAIPIIHSVTNAVSYYISTTALSEALALADASGRKTPMLWIGPPAAGHLDIKGRKGNDEIWRFATDMHDFATRKDVESMGVWNLTVQANLCDGVSFGEGVGIVGMMMVINWLARLESS